MENVLEWFEFTENPAVNRVIGITLTVIVILIMTFVAARIIKFVIHKKVKRSEGDMTALIFIGKFLVGLAYFVGLMTAIHQIPPLQGMTTSLLAGSGVMALIIGFASQQTVANMISGFMISVLKPFKLGDKISFVGDDVKGIVEDITLRHTVIRTRENKRIIVPNQNMNTAIIVNADCGSAPVCLTMELGVDNDADILVATEIVTKLARAHPSFYTGDVDEIIPGAEPVAVDLIGVDGGKSTLQISVWVNGSDATYGTRCDLLMEIKGAFGEEGIGIK